MDTQTIDQEYEKLQTEFQDVAGSVKTLATKLQAAADAGDANAAAWIDDLKHIASDIDDEQSQAHALLLAIHGFITNLAQAQAPAPAPSEEHPPLFAPGQEPQQEEEQPQPGQRRGMMGGMFGGMMGGYGGGGFARSMEMGMAFSLGADLLNGIFR
jgi:hypothetical protein